MAALKTSFWSRVLWPKKRRVSDLVVHQLAPVSVPTDVDALHFEMLLELASDHTETTLLSFLT